MAGLDADHDGTISPAELTAARDAIEGALVGRVQVKGDGAACPGTLGGVALAEQDGVSVRAVYRCPERPRRVDVALAFLDDLSFGHRHLAHASAGAAESFAVLSQRTPSFALDVPPAAPAPAPREQPASSPPFQRGALHVLARFQAPAFLIALLVPCEGRREALRAALLFLGAAAAGLVLGARGIFVPDPHVLGAAVALTLVYAGLDLAAGRPTEGEPRHGRARWHVAVFGLAHGLGAAAVAGDPAVLAGFGAGLASALIVEAAAILMITRWTRRSGSLLARGTVALGAAVAALGLYTLVTS